MQLSLTHSDRRDAAEFLLAYAQHKRSLVRLARFPDGLAERLRGEVQQLERLAELMRPGVPDTLMPLTSVGVVSDPDATQEVR